MIIEKRDGFPAYSAGFRYWQPRHIVRSAGSSGAVIELSLMEATALARAASIAASFSSNVIESLIIPIPSPD